MPHPSPRGEVAPGVADLATSAESQGRSETAALLSNLPGMAYRCRNDARSTVLFVSGGSQELLGFRPERFVGPDAISYEELVHPDDRASVRRRIEAALAERRGFEVRYRVRTADGHVKWVSDCGRGVHAADGTLETVVGFVADITELKTAEGTLREHDDMLSLAFSNARDMMLLARVEPGPTFRVQSVNRRYLDVVRAAGFDVTAEKMTGKTFSELRGIFGFPDEVWEGLLRRYRRVVQTRQPIHYDEVTQTPHGTFHGLSTISAICDDGGNCRCVLYTSSDITERKHAEAALRESEAKFSTAFRASPGAMSISDVDTRVFVEVNAGFGQMLGFTREELVGRTGVEAGVWASEEDRRRFYERLLSDGMVRDLEVTARHRDGHGITCLANARVVEFSGRAHLITSLHDITARKRAEEARMALEGQLRQTQKLDALGQLAGGIAHDFNNILTGIIAYSELAVMDAAEPAEVKKHLATVRHAAERAGDLVRQILTFSRKHARERRPLQLGPVVKEALKLLRSSLPKSIEFVERIEPDVPSVLADATQVHQIVMNLCTNAAHAMRRVPGRLGVTLEAVEWAENDVGRPPRLEPGRYARLSVSDTGEGMDETTLARIFEPFFTTKGSGEGTGLGLSVVHGIVEDHDGSIFVHSRVGQGTTFDVYLPEHEMVAEPAAAEPVAAALGAGQRILFVDDEAVIGGAATMILQRHGFRVDAQTDPRAALALFESQPEAFDILVTDLTMPHLDGMELARRALERRPDLPVLLTTGHSGAWTTEKVRELGLRGLVMKPLSQAKLIKAIGEALATKG